MGNSKISYRCKEGIQERQVFCIRMNLLFDQNAWCSVNEGEHKKVEELTKLGCFNEYGVIQPPPTDPIIFSRRKELK